PSIVHPVRISADGEFVSHSLSHHFKGRVRRELRLLSPEGQVYYKLSYNVMSTISPHLSLCPIKSLPRPLTAATLFQVHLAASLKTHRSREQFHIAGVFKAQIHVMVTSYGSGTSHPPGQRKGINEQCLERGSEILPKLTEHSGFGTAARQFSMYGQKENKGFADMVSGCLRDSFPCQKGIFSLNLPRNCPVILQGLQSHTLSIQDWLRKIREENAAWSPNRLPALVEFKVEKEREEWEREHWRGEAQVQSRSQRSVSRERWVETMVVADSKLIEYHGSENVESYIFTIMNMVENFCFSVLRF
ncbi:hypothetical protein XENOCAPTIV_010327, partial [Xenoophorus captivus]